MIAWAAVLFAATLWAATLWLRGAVWTAADAVGAAAVAGADIATVAPSAAASVVATRPAFVARACVILMLILPEAGEVRDPHPRHGGRAVDRADQSVDRRSAYKADVAGSEPR
ncbi:hypothetical protein [Actinoallomurus oryzae]|uniref:hypothetical protein n=1 Tax=Actinoallomurus oryzae TaxID=502180 RepID=UPI0031EE2E2C